MKLVKGDIVGVAGNGLVSWLIKIFERSPGENKSVISHVGMIVTDADSASADIVESLAQGTIRRPVSSYKSGKLYIMRNRGMVQTNADKIVAKAIEYVGDKYGFLKIIAHAGDYFLGGKYFFRRLCRIDNYPICSWVVAHAYSTIDYRFKGLDPDLVQPDDIWDHCQTNLAAWEVFKL